MHAACKPLADFSNLWQLFSNRLPRYSALVLFNASGGTPLADFSSSPRFREGGVLAHMLLGLLGIQREVQRRPDVCIILRPEASPMGLDDGAADRESHPKSILFRGIEG